MKRVSPRQLGLFDVLDVVPVTKPVADRRILSIVESADATARRAARELATDLVLRAGAGTGKTHTLVETVVHLVAGVAAVGRPVPPQRILLLTFSEKAAAELRERVRARFIALADAPRGDLALDEAYARRAVTPVTGDAWRAAAARLGSADISTFHGFAAGLLRRHAALAGIDPGFELVAEDDARSLLRVAVEESVLARLGDPTVRELVRELDFARGEDAPARGLVEHLASLVTALREEGRSARSISVDDAALAAAGMARAAVDYRAALADLRAALASASSRRLADRNQELDSLAPAIAAVLAALDPARDPLAEPTLVRVAELTAGSLGHEDRHAAQRRLRAAEEALRTAHVEHRAAPLAAALLALADDALGRFQAAKVARGALDFADLILGARDLLAASPAARAAEQPRWVAILVDELQDTNGLQDTIVEAVRGPETRLVAVGDPKQSIYEFRGADVTVFERVAARVSERGGRALALTDSRRALAPLTRFVNQLFARAMTGGVHAFEVAFDPARDALDPRRPTAEACVELIDVEDPDAEPAAIARRVRALVDSAAPIVRGKDESPRAVRFGDVAILLRRFTRLDALLDALRRAGVPHHVVNGRGFYAAQEVRDLAHALALVDDPDDSLALLGVLRSPLVGLSDAALVALAEVNPRRAGAHGRGRPAPLALAPLLAPGFTPPAQLTDGERTRLVDFLGWHAELARHADRLGAAGALKLILDATDLAAVVATTFDGEQRVANLERLVALARAHDASVLPRGDRRAFVRRLGLEAAREKSFQAPAQLLGEHDDVVRVMTVHQAKGLEFPVVVVPECGASEREPRGAVAYDRAAGLGLRLQLADGERIASPRALAAEDLLRARARAESTRLFYVACTRARDWLVLCGGGGNRRAASSTWRALVDEWRAADPDSARLMTVAPELGAPARPAPPTLAEVAAEDLARVARAFTPPATGARVIVVPATQLVDLAGCVRRFHMRHENGLAENPHAVSAAAGTSTRSSRADAGKRCTQAHQIQERIDLADWRARGRLAVDELVAAAGAPADVGDAVAGFLGSKLGRELTARAPETVRREVPFALAVGEAAGTRPRLLV